MEQPGRGPRSRSERAVERGRQGDRQDDRAWMEQYLSEPVASVLVEQLARGAVGCAWVRRRLRQQDRDQAPGE